MGIVDYNKITFSVCLAETSLYFVNYYNLDLSAINFRQISKYIFLFFENLTINSAD